MTCAVALLLPFVMFFWIAPYVGDQTIGHDYAMYPTPHQMELQYSLAHGQWPMHAPGFAGGRPSAVLTLGQMYHPISFISAHIPGYWEGDALDINTLLRLISLGLLNMVLMLLLLRLGLRLEIAFALSFITAYNMRVLDILRFGASLENYTGHALLCAALAYYFVRPRKFLGPALVIASTYLLVVGGHPQMMYFGLFGSTAFALAIPFVLPHLTGERVELRRAGRFYLVAAACGAAGIALASAYIVPLYADFVAETSTRIARGYGWSLLNCDTWGGAINSFFQPLNISVTGGFGGCAIIVPILVFPLLALMRHPVPRGVVFTVVFIALVFGISLDAATPLHRLFWEHFPLASSFRVPGRINMLLPMMILLVLAWLFRRGDQPSVVWGRRLPIPLQTLVLGLSLIVYVTYYLFLEDDVPRAGFPLPARFREIPAWVYPVGFWLGVSVLGLAALHGIRWRGRWIVGALLALAVVSQTWVYLQHGTWVIPKRPTPTLAKMDKQKKIDMGYRGPPGNKLQSDLVGKKMTSSFLDQDLGKFYRNYIVVEDLDGAYEALAQRRTGHQIVVEGYGGKSATDRKYVEADDRDTVNLEEASFNRMVFTVEGHADGFFNLTAIDSHRWKATVDGEETRVYRANAGEQAVFMKAGRHRVEMRFMSAAAVAGMILSLVVLAGVGLFFGWRLTIGRLRIAILVASALLPVAIFCGWWSSLYGGDNLGTEYSWSSAQLPQPDNLAYGRPTSMSSIFRNQMPYPFYAGRAVDGDPVRTAFKTNRKRKLPWWQVDLGHPISIGRVVIHDGGGRSGKNHLPLKVMVSDDGASFELVKKVESRGTEKPWQIDMGGVSGRFVRLKSSGNRVMAFREVMVFPEVPVE